MARSSGGSPAAAAGISEVEYFWSVVHKADRCFSKVRDSPLHARSRIDPEFHKAFKNYTRLWKLQQENRQKLMEGGLKRWEIGEIASRIAQLYYVQYQRTGDSSHLSECYMFYEAVFNREYFKDALSQETGLAKKQLRFLARFLVICLLLGIRDMVARLALELRSLVEDCKMNFKEMELKEWKQAVHDVFRFLKVDTSFMNMRPLRYSYFYDTNPDLIGPLVGSQTKRCLRDAILSSCHHNEVKFSELTLDTFRMVQCLEWDPSGAFAIDQANNGCKFAPISSFPLRDATLPDNPRKAIMHHPLATQYLLFLATVCEELPPDGILLIYLSATGKSGLTVPVQFGQSTTTIENVVGSLTSLDLSDQMSSLPDSPLQSSSRNEDYHNDHECCLWLGSLGNGGSNFLYPSDLIPFTRKPLFLIIDSDVSHSFKVIHGAEKGETAAILLSPRSQPSSLIAANDSLRYQNGSQFTMFLTAPLQAFCFLLGIPSMNVDQDTFNKAENLLSLSLNEWEHMLTASDSLNPVWKEALGDPFLRRILLRFIFCRAVLGLNSSTHGQPQFLPECLPRLPESVLPESPASQSAVKKLVEFFGVVQQFVFSEGIAAPDWQADEHSSSTVIIKPSDINESHFAADNGRAPTEQ